MKRLILSLCSIVLVVNLSIGQDLSTDKWNIEVNHYQDTFLKKTEFFAVEENYSVNFLSKKITENKFNVQFSSLNKKIKVDKKVKKESKKSAKRDLFWLLKNIALVDAMITEGQINENENDLVFSAILASYGERDLSKYKNYDIVRRIQELKVEEEESNILVGKNLLQFINKQFKTEIDKTLNSSLNLVVINLD